VGSTVAMGAEIEKRDSKPGYSQEKAATGEVAFE
jgi:hypothetical protein